MKTFFLSLLMTGMTGAFTPSGYPNEYFDKNLIHIDDSPLRTNYIEEEHFERARLTFHPDSRAEIMTITADFERSDDIGFYKQTINYCNELGGSHINSSRKKLIYTGEPKTKYVLIDLDAVQNMFDQVEDDIERSRKSNIFYFNDGYFINPFTGKSMRPEEVKLSGKVMRKVKVQFRTYQFDCAFTYKIE